MKTTILTMLLFALSLGCIAQTELTIQGGVTALDDSFRGNTLTSEIELMYTVPEINVGIAGTYRFVGVQYLNYNAFDLQTTYRQQLLDNLDTIILIGGTWNSLYRDIDASVGFKSRYHVSDIAFISLGLDQVYATPVETHILGGVGIRLSPLSGPPESKRFF